MPLTMCAMLWSAPGLDSALAEYEDSVLALVARHDGRVVCRVRRTDDEAEQPLEVQVIEFADEAALDRYLQDPDRMALRAERDRCIARTEILRCVQITP